MASIQQEHTIRARPARRTSERPVFADDGGQRARLVRLAGRGAAVVALVWLAALAASMLGPERLPGATFTSVPPSGGLSKPAAPPAASTPVLQQGSARRGSTTQPEQTKRHKPGPPGQARWTEAGAQADRVPPGRRRDGKSSLSPRKV